MAACHSSAAQFPNSPTPGGVQVYYLGNAVSSIPADSAFFSRVNAWVNDFTSTCSIGKPNAIEYLGAYNYKLGTCKSQHEFGQAFDLSGLWFPSGRYWSNLNFPNDKEFTMGIEAGVRKKFRFVAGHLTDSGHADHIHFDALYSSSSFAWADGWEGNPKFLKQSLNSVWGFNFAVNETTNTAASNAASSIAQYWGGAPAGTNITSNAATWQTYCRVTAIYGTN